jgi:hypothetical protein
MPGGLEKRRLEGVCACAPPLEAAPAAAMVIAAAMTLRREAGVAESNSEIMACSLVKLVGRMGVPDRCGLTQLLFVGSSYRRAMLTAVLTMRCNPFSTSSITAPSRRSWAALPPTMVALHLRGPIPARLPRLRPRIQTLDRQDAETGRLAMEWCAACIRGALIAIYLEPGSLRPIVGVPEITMTRCGVCSLSSATLACKRRSNSP